MKKMNRIFFQILALAMILSSAVSNAFAQGGFCINAYVLQEASCSDDDGSATVFIPSSLSGKCTIEWLMPNGGTSSSETITGLAHGSYYVKVRSTTCPNVVLYNGTVVVTQNEGCKLDVIISGPSSLSGSCNGIPPVTFTATASGGTPPYHFGGGWNQVSSTSATKTYQPAGGSFTVTCSVSDDNGSTGNNSLNVYTKLQECAQDPNEIKGPDGYSNEMRFVNSTDKMNYTIGFENDPDFAMAPASRVKITYDVPDKQKLASFRLADFGFGDFVFTVPSNVSSYSQRLDVSDSLGVWVDVNAGIDIINNQLFWIFQSIDPATGAEPASSQMGFLPINDSLEHGQGYVSFYISPVNGVATGDTVGAEALIVFDDNAPIGTNVWTNTFDAVAPTSTLHAEMNTADSLYCTFSFEAQDDANGSGVQNVEVYVSVNNASYISIGGTHPDSTLSYALENGVFYQFMSIATDNVGNKEAFKAQPDTSVNYNTAPIDLVLNGNTFYEYDPVNSQIGTFYTLDNDVNLPFVYELVSGEGDDDNALFTINGNTLRTDTTFVCSHQTEYSVRVRTTDIGGLSYEKSFVLNEVMQHETPITHENKALCQGSSIDFYGRTLTEAGIYTDTLQTVGGCDSIVVWVVKENPTYAVTDAQTICESELPYTWNEVVFTEAGTQTATLQTVNGCDSVVTMTLTVNPTYQISDVKDICESELPYTWNNVVFNAAGTQNVTLQTVNGCDSVVIMTLTVNPIYQVTDTKTICESELPYTWNEVVFTEAGTQTATLQTVNGCDSVVTMTLTVNPIYQVADAQTICESELPYTWNNVVFNAAGTQNVTLQTVNGCDSVVVMTLTVNPIYQVSDTKTICESELPYTWNEVVFNEAGTQTTTLQTVNGCDSVVTMILTVNPIYQVTDTKTICESELPYTWNNVVFNAAGTQNVTLQTVNGCDSVVVMTLTVNLIYQVSDTQTICESELPYSWNNVVFNAAGTQTATLQTVNGCDSVVTMTLTVNPIYQLADAQTICESELPYTWNNVVFNAAGTQNVTLQTVNGCDSVVTMTLTVNPVYQITDTKTICVSQLPYTWNEVVFTEAGTQTTTLQTINGCDSVVTMILTVTTSFNETDTKTICESELPYTWNNVVFNAAGTQEVTLQTVAGCDSVVTMTLTVNPIYQVTDTKTICESELPYTWNNVVFNAAGTQNVTLQTVNGCDSVVAMTLTVNPIYQVTDGKTICESELPYTWNNVVFNAAGTQNVTLQTVNGCDSVVAMTLTVNPIYQVTDTKTICESELPYTWNNVVFNAAGTQNVTLQTVNGCDSVVAMTLTVNPIYQVTDTKAICESELPYTWNNVVFNTAGTQNVTLQTITGCDSVVAMTLTVNPIYQVTDTKTICESELPYTWNGVQFTEAGTQSATLETVNGCDSVVAMTLTVNPIYQVTDAKTICESELPYTWNNVVFNAAGTQNVTLQTVNDCDSVVAMTLTVNPIYQVTDTKTICESELPYTWNNVVFNAAGTQNVTLQTVNGCDSVVAMTLTVNPIYQVTDTKTICESELPYTWNNVVFNAAGTQNVTLQTVNGCDSVVAMTLTVNPIYQVADTQTICESELPYTWNNVVFNAAGTQNVTLQTVNGCDSVVAMTLTVNPIYQVTDTQTICESELPYTWNNVVFNAAGTQNVTLQTVNGCDSVVAMTLTVNPIYQVTDTKTICESELPYTWNEVVFTEAGTQTATLQTVNGCDSVVTMTLTVNQGSHNVYDTTVCESFTWAEGTGETYTQTGIYTHEYTNNSGCASVDTLHLIVNQPAIGIDERVACGSFTWINDSTYTESTTTPTYTYEGGASNGCDSIVTLHLTINYPTTSVDEQVACGSFTWINDSTYTESTNTPTYTIVGGASNGCDSIVTLHLTINQSTTGIDYQEACDSLLWMDGVTYYESTSAANAPVYILTNAAGCDSIVTLNLSLNHSVAVDYYLTISDDDLPYTFGDTTFLPGTVQSGDYSIVLETADGCDSVVTLHLTVTGINDYLMNVEMNVYPNPTNDKVNVQLSVNNALLTPNAEIQLYDMYGKWLKTWKATGETTVIDLSEYAASVYFIKAVDGQRMIGIRKVVKE